ncbi:anti-sigma B factor antagonist [Actinocorallia herbida]|uniref:Anti-sigma factor antagonist n=1 Tax=Actinocorallia herbida TaxID=58109 RepID=A0A3N1CQ85_9ACTN|nr:STAS domain-containing protein [Actinocorallia herbida]ROO82888.1 anti-sigma B factor antagonist [Actinocorallia herbida]
MDYGAEVADCGPYVLVNVHGELDVASEPWFRGALLESIGFGDRAVVLDMRQVRFCAAAGLNSIVATQRMTRGLGPGVAVAGAIPRVRKTFEITRLDRVIPLYDTVPEAVQGLIGVV